MTCQLARIGLGFGGGSGANAQAVIDSGITAAIEQKIIEKLATLKYNNLLLFKTCEVWKGQIDATEGGLEKLDALAPFAFAAYDPPSGERQGGDLCQKLKFAITFGAASKQAGICRIGDAQHPGTSIMRDLIIDALDGWHPGEGFDCDPLYYQDEAEVVKSEKRHAIDMFFECNFITV